MSNSTNFGMKAVAIASILMIVAVAFAPTVYASEDDSTGYRYMTLSEIREEIYKSDPDGDPVYGIEPVTLAFAMGLTAGLFLGGVIGYLIGSHLADNPYDEEQLNTEFSKMEAGTLEVAANTAVHLITSILPSDAELWFFTTDYWNKMMEYIVYDEWTAENAGFDFNSRQLVYNTGLITNAANYLYTWSNSIDEAYNHIFDRVGNWTGGEGLAYTDEMSLSIKWNGGSITATNGLSSGGKAYSDLTLDFNQYITVDEPTVVYIDMETGNSGFSDRNSGMMYNFSGSQKNIVKVDSPNAGTSKTLGTGMNDITDLGSGMYLLPAGTYAGPMVSLIGEGMNDEYPSGTVTGSLVISKGSTCYLFLSDGDETGATYTVYNTNGSRVGTTDYLTISIDEYGGGTTESILLGTDSGNGIYLDVLTAYKKLVDTITDVILRTYEVGDATWTIFDTCEASSSAIHPSTVTVPVPETGVTTEEYLALYLNAMAQIHDYAEVHGENLDGLVIQTDFGSLGLVCYGTIYVNGEAMARDVIFTPYVYTQEQTIYAGQENKFVGTGSAIIWDSEEDFGDWNQQMNITYAAAMGLDSSCVLAIENIIYNGKEVESYTFEFNSITPGGTGSDGDDGNSDNIGHVPDTMDVTLFYALIIAELGLIVILIGRIIGSEVLMLVGVIVLAIGILIPGAIEGLVTGTFDWNQMVPFSWI